MKGLFASCGMCGENLYLKLKNQLGKSSRMSNIDIVKLFGVYEKMALLTN